MKVIVTSTPMHLKNSGVNSIHILIGTNLLNNLQVAIKFEPRKSDAPQLRDEYRTYKILSGTRKVLKKDPSPFEPPLNTISF